MNKKLKEIMLSGAAALLMFAFVGVSASSITVNARHVRKNQVSRLYKHDRKILNHYHHNKRIHKHIASRVHNRPSIHSLELKLATIRFKQAQNSIHVDNFFDYTNPFSKHSVSDTDASQGHTLIYRHVPGTVVYRDQIYKNFNRSKYLDNYIKGLTNYEYRGHLIKDNAARVCGMQDADYYASCLVVKRYARTHHKSNHWLKNNLRHFMVPYSSTDPDMTGYGNFMSGVQKYPLYVFNSYKYDLKYTKQNDKDIIDHSYIPGMKYSYKVKLQNYKLRKPTYTELNYLIHSHYVHYDDGASDDTTNTVYQGE